MNARKLIIVIMAFLAMLPAYSQNVWTVRTVPNTRLKSNEIHVSDPDGFISDSSERFINEALGSIRNKADVFVVLLSSVGEVESKRFATELFNYWGIGDAATKNGVLLLLVEDQHRVEFETGYGVEATLTDARCQQIFDKTMKSYFKQGDYESGFCAGVAQIVKIYGGKVPEAFKSNLSSGSQKTSRFYWIYTSFSIFFKLFLFFALIMSIVGLFCWIVKRKTTDTSCDERIILSEEGNATYINSHKIWWRGSPWQGRGLQEGLMLGLSIWVILALVVFIVYLVGGNFYSKPTYTWIAIIALLGYDTWICFRQNQAALKKADKLAKVWNNPKEIYQVAFKQAGTKFAIWLAPWLGWVYLLVFRKKIKDSKTCCCPVCGSEMKGERYELPENHKKESHLEALKFTPYRCANGHLVVLSEAGRRFSNFRACEKCGCYTSKRTEVETITEASYSHAGQRMETYVCQNCGDTETIKVTIPTKEVFCHIEILFNFIPRTFCKILINIKFFRN